MAELTGHAPYRIIRPLGHGGMGTVFEATDERTGRSLALKRLTLEGHDAAEYRIALFQREYQTLSRLRHPVVVDVFEYGVDATGPYYTMELLGGDDLKSLLPLGFERACAILRDVASALSLLHTRGLVHRDITARNIRVLGNGTVKLFDFGTLAPMGYAGSVVGTPPYVPPEALLSQALDARSDLFALGVVLYQTLSGELPYPGQTWKEIQKSWQGGVVDIGARVTELPEELARLTMALIAPNRAARPRHAGRVMVQLGSFAGLRTSEPPSVSRAYLVAPDIIGRDTEMLRVRQALDDGERSAGGALVVTGPAGVGRSRLLEEAALAAKISGAVVLSGGPTAAQPFSLAHALLETLIRLAPAALTDAAGREPELCAVLLRDRDRTSAPPDLAAGDVDQEVAPPATYAEPARRADVMGALRHVFLHVSRQQRLVIVIDDLPDVDEPSAAWLATLLHQAHSHRLIVISSIGDDSRERMAPAHRLIAELSETVRLGAFDREQTGALVRTVFGEVPGADVVATSLFRLSQGLPREVMALCEHLVDAGLVTYRGGSFSLPTRIAAEDLPPSIAASHAQVARSLSRSALRIGQALTISPGQTLTLLECNALFGSSAPGTAQFALEELALRRIVASDGFRYRIAHNGWARALEAELDSDCEASLHRDLARVHGRRNRTTQTYHLLLGGNARDALPAILDSLNQPDEERLGFATGSALTPRAIDRMLGTAVESAERLGLPRRQISELQHVWMMAGVYADYTSFEKMRPIVVEALKRDSGFYLYHAPARPEDEMQAALAAVQGAQARFDETAPDDRVRPPAEAIRALVQFAAAGIAIGARTANWPMRRTLPALLKPFVVLSPAVKAIHENCLSVVDLGFGRYEGYRARSLAVLEQLSQPSGQSVPYGDEIRAAVTFGVSSAEARLGLASALERLDTLADHPRLRANAADLKAYLYLQQGDFARAAECRRLAERLDMESTTDQMFGSKFIRNDAEIHARAGDITGVGHLVHRLKELASTFPGWLPAYHAALGEYERLRGEPERALGAFDRALALLEPLMTDEGGTPDWYWCAAARLELLSDLGRHDEATAQAETLLGLAAAWSPSPAREVRFHGIMRAAAITQARAGARARGLELLAPAIAYREHLGATGLFIGLLYEAQAEIARAAGREELFAESAKLATHHFCLVEDSGFFSRSRWLQDRAQSTGLLDSEPSRAARDATTVLSRKTGEQSR